MNCNILVVLSIEFKDKNMTTFGHYKNTITDYSFT